MHSAARVRLFVAYRLPAPAVDAIADWQRRYLSGLHGVRLLTPDHLHITLAFLGDRPVAEVDIVGTIVETCVADADSRPVLVVDRYRETPRVGMLVLREPSPAGSPLARHAERLADCLMSALQSAGIYQREPRPWRPHVTVARFRRPPRLTPPMPQLEAFSPVDVTVFRSVTAPEGSVYSVLRRVGWES